MIFKVSLNLKNRNENKLNHKYKIVKNILKKILKMMSKDHK